mmetsp:Transcript_20994/g.39010  ORF Transcript_20994/g.39010 Transcript_20994/m.39010 type:complete len:850 (-) Transcript_20994:74-2623(-)
MLPPWPAPVAAGYEPVGGHVYAYNALSSQPFGNAYGSGYGQAYNALSSQPLGNAYGQKWNDGLHAGSNLKHRARDPVLAPAPEDSKQRTNGWHGKDVGKKGDVFPVYTQDKPRVCTDIPCLIVLAVVVVGILAISITAWAIGNPAWLCAGWNLQAQICGVDEEVQSSPFVYWPVPVELGGGHCVQQCPSFEDFVNEATIPVLRPETLLVQEDATSARVLYSQAIWSQQVPIYPTMPAMGRYCLPAPEEALSQPSSSSSNETRRMSADGSIDAQDGGSEQDDTKAGVKASASMLVDVQEKLGCTACQLRRGIGSVWIIRWRLVLWAILMPCSLGAALAAVACCSSDCALWLVVLGVGIGSLALGSFLLTGAFFTKGADDFIVPTLDSLQLLLAWIVGGVLVVMSLCVFCTSFASRHLLQWAAACLKVTLDLLRNSGLCAPVTFISAMLAIIQSCAGILWIWVLTAAVSSAVVSWPPEMPSMDGDPTSVFSKVADYADDQMEIVPGGPLVRGLRREPIFLCHPALVILLFGFLLHALRTFFTWMGQYLTANLVLRWYFFGTSGQQHWSGLCKSCAELTSAHMGSIASGTLRWSFLPLGFLSVCTTLCHKRLSPWRTSLRSPGLQSKRQSRGCSRCLGACCGNVCVATSSAPFAEVALNGGDYQASVRAVATSLSRALPALQFLFGLPVIFQVAVSTLSSLAAAACLLVSVQGQDHKTPGYVEMELGVALVAALLALSPASAWVSVHAAAFDALCLCFMVDDYPEEQSIIASQNKLKQPFQDARLINAGETSDSTSRGLWTSGYTPPLFRALIFQADQMLQSMGPGGDTLRAPEGYAAVFDSSESEVDEDSS